MEKDGTGGAGASGPPKRVGGGPTGKPRARVAGRLVGAPLRRMVGKREMVAFRVVEPGRSQPVAGWYPVAEHEAGGPAGERLDARLAELEVGTTVTLAGHWRRHWWTDVLGVRRHAWEFAVQLFGPGDVTVRQLYRQTRPSLASLVGDWLLQAGARVPGRRDRGNGVDTDHPPDGT